VQADGDHDGIANVNDNCPAEANADQADANNDGVGDACEDDDSDHIANSLDNCRYKSNYQQEDTDRDGLGDACDEVDSRWTEQNQWIVWLTIGLVVIVIGFLAFRVVRKVNEPKLEIEEEPVFPDKKDNE